MLEILGSSRVKLGLCLALSLTASLPLAMEKLRGMCPSSCAQVVHHVSGLHEGHQCC